MATLEDIVSREIMLQIAFEKYILKSPCRN